MMKRKLGRSDIDISAMGLGCWAIGGPYNRTSDGETFSPMGWGQIDDDESIRAIHAALDLGVKFIDTANNYGAGHSETIVGKAIKDRRDQVVVATKFGSVFDEAKKLHYDKGDDFIITPEFIRAACEESLRRLQTEYIDLYQFHWGSYDETRALDVLATLEELVVAGKIRTFGWSTDHPHLAAIFAQSDNCTAIQHRVNVFAPANEMLALCQEQNLASINKSPLNAAILSGKIHENYKFEDDDGRKGVDWKSEPIRKRLAQVDALRDVLSSNGRTMAQGALAWIWAHSEQTIPIPGFKNVKQTTENANAMSFGPLTSAQMDDIEKILERDA
ncbi:MAG: aldo/keto reductase [Chloroflexi bacterium]|nr:aldo/keto reductase [Chloroflexota bacterium]